MERISDETMQLIRGMAINNPGADRRHHCPKCHSTRKNQQDRTFSIKAEGAGILFNCWHCGFSGAIPSSYTQRQSASYTHPKTNGHQTLTPSGAELEMAYQWLSSRGLKRSTAESVGILAGMQFIKGEMRFAVGFPYGEQSNPSAVKWRATTLKAFTQTGHAKGQSMWLAERVKQGDPLVICEGEMDALSIIQAGIHAVSVPNGAPMSVTHTGHTSRSATIDHKFSYVWQAKDLIERAPRVVIAVDSDDPGNALAEEIARRIGRAKCWRALWPDGCKDANDVLVRHGAVVLRECIENAQPWPVKGLYVASHFLDKVMALYDKGYAKGLSTGFSNVDDIYTVVPGQLTIVTGIPGHGKSTFLDNALVHLAKKQAQRFAVCSFENPPEVHIAKLAALATARPFFSGPTPRMDHDTLVKTAASISDHFIFLHQSDGSLSSLDEIIDLAKAAVMRYGINGLVIDPYNYLDRGTANETDWVSDALTKLKLFAMAHDVHVWLVAHPTKIRRRDDGSVPIPTGYDIAGSAHFYNKADMGITIHRPDLQSDQTEVHTWKVRFSFHGKIGRAKLTFNAPTGSFFSPVSE